MAHEVPTAQDAARPEDCRDVRRLAEAARDGNRAAFARLHERYAPMVHGILLAHVGVQDADDLVQDVFVRALDRIGGLREADAFGPWIAAIARSVGVRFHRRRRRVDELPRDLPGEHPSGAPDDRATASEALAALAAIRSLPEAYRETLVLRLAEGLTGPQIAAHTGLTPGSVRVNLHRGLKLLRARLRLDDLPEDPR